MRQLNKTGTTLSQMSLKLDLQPQGKFLLWTVQSDQFITEKVGHLAAL